MNSDTTTTVDPDELSPLISDRQRAGWDLQNASRNYLWLVVSYGATAGFALASVLLLTRSLGPENYGGIIAIIAASQVVQIFINWSAVAMTRFGIEEFVKTGTIRNSFWSRAYILGPNLALALALATLWFPPLSSWLKLPAYAFLLVIVNLLSGVLWQHFQYSLQGIKLAGATGCAGSDRKTFDPGSAHCITDIKSARPIYGRTSVFDRASRHVARRRYLIITAERNTDLLWGALGETLIFVPNGTVVAGIDLAQMQPTDVVVVDPDTVMVFLPPAEVFDLPVLDNDRSYVANRDTGLFASTDPQLETQVRQAAEAEIIAAAYEAQIVATAQTNAEAYLTTFMNNLGFTEVIFTDAPPPPAPPYVPVVPKGYVVVTVTPSP